MALKRNNLGISLTFMFIAFLIVSNSYGQGSTVAFEISEPDLIPEGIAYDSKNKRFYVSSTYKRKIVEVDEKGVSRDFISQAQYGTLGVVGMRVDVKRRLLWTLSGNVGPGMPMINSDTSLEGVSRVHVYNVDSRQLIRQFELNIPGEKNFLNDLTVADNGDVYLTDTQSKRIYRIVNGSSNLELFIQLDTSMSPNGIDITPDQKSLFIAVYGGKHVIKLNLKTKSYDAIQLPPGERISADGIYYYQNSLVAVQPGNKERIVARYSFDQEQKRIDKIDVLDNSNEHFSQPTTGVIVGNHLYCIANSQLQLFKSLYTNGQGKYNTKELKNPIVLKIPFN